MYKGFACAFSIDSCCGVWDLGIEASASHQPGIRDLER